MYLNYNIQIITAARSGRLTPVQSAGKVCSVAFLVSTMTRPSLRNSRLPREFIALSLLSLSFSIPAFFLFLFLYHPPLSLSLSVRLSLSTALLRYKYLHCRRRNYVCRDARASNPFSSFRRCIDNLHAINEPILVGRGRHINEFINRNHLKSLSPASDAIRHFDRIIEIDQ